jgi:hypothetical protein
MHQLFSFPIETTVLFQQVDKVSTMKPLPLSVLKSPLSTHEQDGEAPWTTHLFQQDMISAMKPLLAFLLQLLKHVGVAPLTMHQLHSFPINVTVRFQQLDKVSTTKPLPLSVLKSPLSMHEQDGEAPWTTHLFQEDVISAMKPLLAFLLQTLKHVGVAPSTMHQLFSFPIETTVLFQQVDEVSTMKPLPLSVLKPPLSMHEQDGEAPWTTHSFQQDMISAMKPLLAFLLQILKHVGVAPSTMHQLHSIPI